MALASYADLQAAIANYLARPGDSLVSTPAPDSVTLATMPPLGPTLAPGLTIGFTAGFSNTGPCTLNPNGLGAQSIKLGVPKTDLSGGEIVAGAAYQVYYDGTDFVLVPLGGVPLPAGYLEMRAIFVQGSPQRQLSPV